MSRSNGVFSDGGTERKTATDFFGNVSIQQGRCMWFSAPPLFSFLFVVVGNVVDGVEYFLVDFAELDVAACHHAFGYVEELRH